ncbi:hypothetical protein [Nocardioides sp.]|uniref:hypothetical protein n=1 Tax=Nocardioides sp. TaxID=35761 RepID=UPI00260A4AA2|nr:hypothetical protein [Nocardioides sp.]
MKSRFKVAAPIAAAASLLAVTGTAFAAAPVNVTAGSSSTGTTTYTAATTGTSPQISFYTPYVNMSCGSGTAAGKVYLGAPTAGKIADITSTTWTSCIGPLGLTMHVYQSGTWTVNGTNVASGVTTGTVGNISATVIAVNPSTGLEDSSLCSFVAAGSIPGTFTNSTQTLATTAGGTLAITSATGCSGQVVAGDSANFVAKYVLTAAAGAVTVS